MSPTLFLFYVVNSFLREDKMCITPNLYFVELYTEKLCVDKCLLLWTCISTNMCGMILLQRSLTALPVALPRLLYKQKRKGLAQSNRIAQKLHSSPHERAISIWVGVWRDKLLQPIRGRRSCVVVFVHTRTTSGSIHQPTTHLQYSQESSTTVVRQGYRS